MLAFSSRHCWACSGYIWFPCSSILAKTRSYSCSPSCRLSQSTYFCSKEKVWRIKEGSLRSLWAMTNKSSLHRNLLQTDTPPYWIFTVYQSKDRLNILYHFQGSYFICLVQIYLWVKSDCGTNIFFSFKDFAFCDLLFQKFTFIMDRVNVRKSRRVSRSARNTF